MSTGYLFQLGAILCHGDNERALQPDNAGLKFHVCHFQGIKLLWTDSIALLCESGAFKEVNEVIRVMPCLRGLVPILEVATESTCFLYLCTERGKAT